MAAFLPLVLLRVKRQVGVASFPGHSQILSPEFSPQVWSIIKNIFRASVELFIRPFLPLLVPPVYRKSLGTKLATARKNLCHAFDPQGAPAGFRHT